MLRLLYVFLILCSHQLVHAQLYSTHSSEINFVSDAPLEIIKASSTALAGILDAENKTFAFRLSIRTFDGFNNSLQREHFYENYMEVILYPTATFKGKIIEDLQLDKEATYRAKGIFEIHGIKNELIINVRITPSGEDLNFSSDFNIALADHDIQLPRIVYQKIAEIISVSVQGSLQPRS